MEKKIRLLVAPFLLIAIAYTVLYSLLHWLLFINLQIFPVKENILELWAPLVLVWVPVLLWLRPRIRLLNLKRKKGDLPLFYLFVAGMAIVAPTLIAQKYIVTATGKLTALQTPREIAGAPKTKFYTLQRHYTDHAHAGVYKTIDISGKNNEYFNMHIFLAMPLLADSTDTARGACNVWIGHEYDKTVSSRKSQDEKKEALSIFLHDTKAEFDYTNFDEFAYLDRAGNTDAREGFEGAIKTSPWKGAVTNDIFLAVETPYAARNGNKLAWIFGALGIGAAVWLLMALLAKFDEGALARYERRAPAEFGAGGGVAGGLAAGGGTGGMSAGDGSPESGRDERAASLFIPRKGYFITPILVDLNLLVFLAMVLSGAGFISINAHDLLNWGGNYRPDTVDDHEWWRLLTNIFLHAGIMHLAANMIGLLFVGVLLEPMLGRTKFAVCYLVTGILASATSLCWHAGTVSIGASGAIFGLFGVFIALMLTKVYSKEVSNAFFVTTLIFVLYNLFAGLAGGVDNSAHLGGLASGLIAGFILTPGIKRRMAAGAVGEDGLVEDGSVAGAIDR
jgi:rhomboid protease GluP